MKDRPERLRAIFRPRTQPSVIGEHNDSATHSLRISDFGFRISSLSPCGLKIVKERFPRFAPSFRSVGSSTSAEVGFAGVCGACAMAKSLKRGDAVEWGSSAGKIRGKVERKVTGTKRIKGHVAKATKDEPQYEVKSDKTGAHAIHKPEELKKVGAGRGKKK